MSTSANGILSVKATSTTDTIVSICGDTTLTGLTVAHIDESVIESNTYNSFGVLFSFMGQADGLNILFEDALNSSYIAVFNDGTADYTVTAAPCLAGYDNATSYYPVPQ